jgi:hypothetical protein
MKNQSPSFVESLGFFTATTVMAMVLFFCVFALAVPVFLLGERFHLGAFRVVAVAIVVIGFIGSNLVAKQIVARMTSDSPMSFWLAVRHTYYHYVLQLAFLPMVGPLIQRIVERGKSRNAFTSDEN